MRKILFLFLFVAIGFSLMAQDNSAPAYTFGVRAGVNGSSLLIRQISFSYISGKNYTSTQKMKIGAHAGFVFDVPIKNKFHFQTGLLYVWQRFGQEQQCRYTEGDIEVSTSSYSIGSINTYTTHHLRLPLMINYHFSTKPNHLVVGAGLFLNGTLSGMLAYDASAIVTTNSVENGTTTTTTQHYFGSGSLDPYKNERQRLYYTIENEDYVNSYTVHNGKMLKRMDVGAALELGYQISQFYIGAGAYFGLLNMCKDKSKGGFFSNGFAQRNFNLQLTFGYNIQ